MSDYLEATITAATRAKGIEDFTTIAAQYFGYEPSEIRVEVRDAEPILLSDGGFCGERVHINGYEMRLRAWKEK